ncbi:MAG: class I SAM-dependent methyltransferase [Candidatus Sigynarchaeota archaeon]
MDVDFEKEKAWWDAKAPHEESDERDEWVNRALRWREIERSLDGVESILDIGGGTGAFSIPLAERGFDVTHLDISPEMLSRARKKAGNLKNIRFVEGNASDLNGIPSSSFDLVLNMDGAISFSGTLYRKAIAETCRVTRKRVLITVSHQALMSAIWVDGSVQESGRILDAVGAMFDSGEWHQDQFADNKLLSKGCTQDYFGAFKAFLPAELKQLLENEGMVVTKCKGLGTLALLCSEAALKKVAKDAGLKVKFLDLCEVYDEKMLPGGFGTRQRAGLLAIGTRR